MYFLQIHEIDIDKKGKAVPSSAYMAQKERRKCKRSVECLLTFNQLASVCFDASTELFDIRNYIRNLNLSLFCRPNVNSNKVLSFFEQNDDKFLFADFEGINKAIDDFTNGKSCLSDISFEMGKNGVMYQPNPYYLENDITYHCPNIETVFWCILYFLVSNGYKFAICRHCGKMFARCDDKVLYCNRISPLREKEKRIEKRASCAFAVKQELDKFDHRRESIRKTMENKTADGAEDKVKADEENWEKLQNFLETYAEYRKKAKYNGSVEFLSEFRVFLYDNPNLPKAKM